MKTKFKKKYPIQPPNGMLPICKLPFLNGRYCDGAGRALWALSQFVRKYPVNICSVDSEILKTIDISMDKEYRRTIA